MAKLQQLVALLACSKTAEADAPLWKYYRPSTNSMKRVMPATNSLRQLCQRCTISCTAQREQLQKRCSVNRIPESQYESARGQLFYLRGEVELVRLPEAEGRIAAEGALPTRRECCVVPGEIRGGSVLCVTSAPRKKDQPAAGLLRLNCRWAFISKNTTAVSRSGATSLNLVTRAAPR